MQPLNVQERWLGLLLLSFQTIGVVYGGLPLQPSSAHTWSLICSATYRRQFKSSIVIAGYVWSATEADGRYSSAAIMLMTPGRRGRKATQHCIRNRAEPHMHDRAGPLRCR